MIESSQSVSRAAMLWVLFAQLLTLIPLFLQLAFWLPLVFIITLAWRFQIYRGAWSYPNNTVKVIIGVLCIVGLYASYAGQLGLEPMVAFLVASFSLKIVEVRKRNDVILILSVGFFAVAAQFLFIQSVWMALYGLVCVVVIFTAWESVFRKRPRPLGGQLRSSSVLLAQALPLIVILFLVVPRIHPLWNIPNLSQSAKTGFSDSISPGDISNLVRSNETAFRVEFLDENIPPPSERYWRGLVFEAFDGQRWRGGLNNWFGASVRGSHVPHFEWDIEINRNAATYQYLVLLEPHYQQWLFTLPAPVNLTSNSARAGFLDNLLVSTEFPIASRVQYRVESVNNFRYHAENLVEAKRRRNLDFPKTSNPQTRALAQSWVDEGLDDQAIIARALAMFNSSFVYTLQPPPLGRHAADEFLFTTQRGFCEHYASSFVLLMRAAGIPARMIGGYQGGQFTDQSEYMIVRQSDAHAWAEVWLPDEGWRRVDPTAAVAPERIELGLQDTLSQSESGLIAGAVFRTGALSWVGKIQLYFDLLDYQWSSLVLSYDSESQSRFLGKILGEVTVARMVVFMGIVSGVLGTLYFLFYFSQYRQLKLAPAQMLYRRFLKRMKRLGYAPNRGESPSDFAKRVYQKDEKLGEKVKRFTKYYTQLAYAEHPQSYEASKSVLNEI